MYQNAPFRSISTCLSRPRFWPSTHQSYNLGFRKHEFKADDVLGNLNISLFGLPTIIHNGQLIQVDTRKAIALISYLAVKARPISRDSLELLLWTEYDQQRASAALRRTLSVAHKALDRTWLNIDRNQVELTITNELFVDTNNFSELVRRYRSHSHTDSICEKCYFVLREAIGIYKDDFLHGFNLKESSNFEDWQTLEAEKHRHDLYTAYEGVVKWHTQNKNVEAAIDYTHQWLNTDPYHEPAIFQLMQHYISAGQRSMALHEYEEYCRRIERDFGTEPLDETSHLYEAILAGHEPPKIFELALNQISVGNFPVFAKSFIGREQELQLISQRLESAESRLISLIGIGGIGKTALVMKVAEKCQGRFPDGVCLVPLHETNTEEGIISQLAEAIGIAFYNGTSPKKQLMEYLKHRRLLIVLDGFEVCMGYAVLLNEILQQALHIRFIVTSHEPLRLSGEQSIKIDGLTEQDAMSLFMANARRVAPQFDTDLACVQQLCGLLDGMPLALELASHWVDILSCTEIIQEILLSLDFLENTNLDAPERHANLRRIFEYSWKHLDDTLKQDLGKLAVFADSFSRHAAETVTGVSLVGLSALTQRSLLVTNHGRYHIPPILKRYVSEVLELDEALLQKHSHYFGYWLNQKELHGLDQQQTLDEITTELQNIHMGWKCAIQEHNISIALIYIDNLFVFYEIQSHFEEGSAVFRDALAKLRRIMPGTRSQQYLQGKLLTYLGCFQIHLGDLSTALEMIATSRELLTRLEAWEELGQTLNYMGVIGMLRGQYAESEQYFERSLEIYQEFRNELGLAKILNNLGILWNRQAQYEKAKPLLQRSLQIYRSKGDQRLIAYTFNNLGNAALGLHQFDEALAFFEDSRRMKLALNDRWGTACSLMNLGEVAQCQLNYDRAQTFFTESLAICENIGKQSGTIQSLRYLASLEENRGNLQKAAEYYFDSLRRAVDINTPSVMLDILLDVARIYLQRGLEEEAAKILHIIIHDTQSRKSTREKATSLRQKLSRAFPIDTYSLSDIIREVSDLSYYSEKILLRHLFSLR